MTILNNQNFFDFIKEGYTIVDMYADWCGPC
ncbi:MAG: thioredoxin domain-containing protein, partial [Candidatus Dojkabacteria bacterium]|nr:thioredoxin domain-containing protein [Candidatus Dojkabacteria bacterium]